MLCVCVFVCTCMCTRAWFPLKTDDLFDDNKSVDEEENEDDEGRCSTLTPVENTLQFQHD